MCLGCARHDLPKPCGPRHDILRFDKVMNGPFTAALDGRPFVRSCICELWLSTSLSAFARFMLLDLRVFSLGVSLGPGAPGVCKSRTIR